MKGGSIYSGITSAISSGSRAAANAAAAAAKAAAEAASKAAALAIKYGPTVIDAGMTIANHPLTAQIVESPQFKEFSEAALKEAMARFSGSGKKGGSWLSEYAKMTPEKRAAHEARMMARQPTGAQLQLYGSGKKGGSIFSNLATNNTPRIAPMPYIPIQHVEAPRRQMPPPSTLRADLEKIGLSKIEIDRMVEDYTRDYAKMNGGLMGTYEFGRHSLPGVGAASMRKKLLGSGDYPALEKAMKGKGSGRGSERAQIVKSVMKEQGLSLPMASKYVKEHNLY
jgi:hypothetical protein